MTFDDRLADILARMREAKLDAVVALHDGAHFIEKPNPVTVLTGFKSLGPAAAILRGDGGMTLIVAPAWDAERATEQCPQARVVGADDIVDALTAALSNGARKNAGLAGMRFLPWSIAERVAAALPAAPSADKLVFDAARTKTDDEIAYAREATRIAELGYRRLLDVARPGMSEDELAAELKWFMKTLGADDNFLLLCASPHNRAVQPSTGRRFQKGDIILAEITPSVRGQLAQICRTVVVGEASAELAEKYALVVHAMDQGIAAAQPGVPMAEVCRAINTVLEAKGYARVLPPAAHPPARPRPRLRLDAARRRRARQRHGARAGHDLHDPPEPVSAGDRLSALRRAGAADGERRGAAHRAEGRAGHGGGVMLMTAWRSKAAPSTRWCSPPPCGEGLGVGVVRGSIASRHASPPSPTLPHKGGGSGEVVLSLQQGER